MSVQCLKPAESARRLQHLQPHRMKGVVNRRREDAGAVVCDEPKTCIERTLALTPDFIFARYKLAFARLVTRSYEQAIASSLSSISRCSFQIAAVISVTRTH